MLRPDKRARAYVASAKPTNFTFCDKRHGETGLHCVMETALACEAPMHMQHCRDRSAVMQTRNSALKWIKQHINKPSMLGKNEFMNSE